MSRLPGTGDRATTYTPPYLHLFTAWLQKAGLALGAPLGRALGYRPTYAPEVNVPAIPAV